MSTAHSMEGARNPLYDSTDTTSKEQQYRANGKAGNTSFLDWLRQGADHHAGRLSELMYGSKHAPFAACIFNGIALFAYQSASNYEMRRQIKKQKM